MTPKEWCWIVLGLIAVGFAIMQVRACVVCMPQHGQWDAVRGTLCHGEVPEGDR